MIRRVSVTPSQSPLSCLARAAQTIRITTTEFAANKILSPALAEILPRYPDICVEAVIDNDLTDIVEGQFDAGIRPGSWSQKT